MTVEHPVTLPFAEVIQVYHGFWMCLLCAQPGRPGLGRHWSDAAYGAAVVAGTAHLRERHHLREAVSDV